MLHVLEFLLGLIIVAVALSDVFSSVLTPRPSAPGLRVGPMLNRGLAPVWRQLARRFASARWRQSVRASLAPAIMLGALAAWVSALTLGFALMLHAQPQNVHLDHFGLGEALFQASLAISTLGMIHADITGWARAVVAVAGIAGFSVLSLVVTFLLQVQTALHRRESLVLTLDARAGRPPHALALATAMAGSSDAALARFFGDWEIWTGQVEQSHLSYPVLFRFRSLHENGEWLACLGAVLDYGALIRAIAPDTYPDAARAAGFLSFTASRALHEFARLLALPPAPPVRDQADGTLLAAALLRVGALPRAGHGVDERLRALRADHTGRLIQLSARLEHAWCDTLAGPHGL